MPLIWAAISGHGFGHAAQVVPVLNALGCVVPDLRVLLRTTVPASFFIDRLKIPWEASPVPQDIGCIQQGPLTINIEATWREHHQFHSTWNERILTEIEAMRAAKPDLILADTPYLAVAAGKAAAIPTVALASFTWDMILSEYQAPPGIDTQSIMQSIRQAYGQADLGLRLRRRHSQPQAAQHRRRHAGASHFPVVRRRRAGHPNDRDSARHAGLPWRYS